jgi:hypothetical protein
MIITVLTYTKLMLALQHFVKNSYTKSHADLTNCLVTDTTTYIDAETNSVST